MEQPYENSTVLIYRRPPTGTIQTETQPLVTVITATYNLSAGGREKFVKQWFESVHSQTYPNIEPPVIDVASTDGTVALPESYQNKGIAHAKGKYISDAT